jgi:anti-anti-sigma factor
VVDELVVSVSALGACVVVALSGVLDARTAGRVREVLALQVGARVRRVVVELSNLWFIDSAGMRVLLEARDALVALGRSLVVASPQRVVARAMEMMAGDQPIPVYGSVEEAVAG